MCYNKEWLRQGKIITRNQRNGQINTWKGLKYVDIDGKGK